MKESIRHEILEKVIPKGFENRKGDLMTFTINASRKFEVGGPGKCIGKSGRRTVNDLYSNWTPNLGAQLSGRDPSKIEVAATLYSRYIAKSLVSNGLCY
jgi:S-adenosylmethionine synthetase